ncbi:MAG: hypothetical protein HJJLKODD_00286 [Phycisphaerae bacterium]|nr:hypothetical protein [Phycisphaerae bacterium]
MESGGVLLQPDPRQWLALIEANQTLVQTYPFQMVDMTAAEYRNQVRWALGLTEGGQVIADGHQPDWHHPGVWAKRAVTQELARRSGGQYVHWVVDSDRIKQPQLILPRVVNGLVEQVGLPWPAQAIGDTYEQWPTLTSGQIDEWQKQLEAITNQYNHETLMAAWIEGLRLGSSGVGQLCAAHQAVDRLLGGEVRHLFSSSLPQETFIADLLINADRFSAAYNQALARYRQSQNIRGNRHPIPDLEQRDGWLELPIWVVVKPGGRQRLWLRRQAASLVLTADQREIAEVSMALLNQTGNRESWFRMIAEQWGFRLRALTFTMWVRMFATDFFIHGLGGAQYDQITDQLIRNYYGVEPPAYGWVTATLHLPLPVTGVDEVAVRSWLIRRRDRNHNPQRYLDDKSQTLPMVEERSQLIHRGEQLRRDEPRNHSARQQIFNAIHQINSQLAKYYLPEENGEELALLEKRWASDRLARDREYFYALFPGSSLRELREQLIRQLT